MMKLRAWMYTDNLVVILGAIQTFMVTKNVEKLVKSICRAIYEAVEETIGREKMAGVDPTKMINGMSMFIGGLAPALGLETPEDEPPSPFD